MAIWTTSPVNEIIDDALELSEGLIIEDGELKALGTDGGFVDEFDGSVLDTAKWPTSSNASVSDGMLNLTGGDALNYSDKFVASPYLSIANNESCGMFIYVRIPLLFDVQRGFFLHTYQNPAHYPYTAFGVVK